MARPLEVYLVDVPFEDINESKVRPALVVRATDDEYYMYKVTSKYNPKDKFRKKHYYVMKDWHGAGLTKKSYIDTHRAIAMPKDMVEKGHVLGKITAIDKVGLAEFISNK